MLRHTWIIYAPNLAACADFLMKERVQLPVSSRQQRQVLQVQVQVQMKGKLQLKV